MRDQLRVVLAVARDPRLARLELAYFGFNMAELGTWMAILVYAYNIGGAGTAALFAAIMLVPAGVVAPFAAYAGDRFRRDRVLLVGYLVQAGCQTATAIALLAHAPVPVTLVAAIAASISVMLTRPIQSTILPSLTRTPSDLTAANAVSGLAESIARFGGPFVAGLLLVQGEPGAVFAVFAVTSLIGAALVAGLPPDLRGSMATASSSAREIVRDAFGGFAALRDERRVLLLVVVLAAWVVVAGALDILFVATAIDLLQAGQSWAGFLGAAFGVGSVVGAFASVTLIGRRRLTPSLARAGGLLGLPISILAFAASIVSAPILFAVSGAGGSIGDTAGRTLLQRVTPEAVQARVFGVVEGMRAFALAIGSVGAGLLVGAFGITSALVLTGLVVPAVLAVSWTRLRAIDRDARAPDPEALTLLRNLPLFAPLSATSIERILGELTWLDVPAGQVLIREGDIGDRFYVIAEGRVEASLAGQHLAERGPGDYFGEIALLRDVPRTASVTAITPLRVIAIERGRFLDAVTGHAQALAHAEAVATEQMLVGTAPR